MKAQIPTGTTDPALMLEFLVKNFYLEAKEIAEIIDNPKLGLATKFKVEAQIRDAQGRVVDFASV